MPVCQNRRRVGNPPSKKNNVTPAFQGMCSPPYLPPAGKDHRKGAESSEKQRKSRNRMHLQDRQRPCPRNACFRPLLPFRLSRGNLFSGPSGIPGGEGPRRLIASFQENIYRNHQPLQPCLQFLPAKPEAEGLHVARRVRPHLAQDRRTHRVYLSPCPRRGHAAP